MIGLIHINTIDGLVTVIEVLSDKSIRVHHSYIVLLTKLDTPHLKCSRCALRYVCSGNHLLICEAVDRFTPLGTHVDYFSAKYYIDYINDSLFINQFIIKIIEENEKGRFIKVKTGE